MYICARSMKTHASLLSIKYQVYKIDTLCLYALLLTLHEDLGCRNTAHAGTAPQHRWVLTPYHLHVVLDSLKFL